MKYTPEKLKEFEKSIVELFNDGKLKSPIHLSGSKDNKQEEALIKIFKDIRKEDWCFSTYRSHYHALLKGIPETWLKDWILDNKSIHVMNKEYKFVTSAIVAGCIPIAIGTAMAIKHKYKSKIKEKVDMDNYFQLTEEQKREYLTDYDKKVEELRVPHVYCFIGDMTATLGTFKDCCEYAYTQDLPITFIIEDNGLSTDTSTGEVWGVGDTKYWFRDWQHPNVIYYEYERIYPHYGSGQFVSKIWDEVSKEDIKNKGF